MGRRRRQVAVRGIAGTTLGGPKGLTTIMDIPPWAKKVRVKGVTIFDFANVDIVAYSICCNFTEHELLVVATNRQKVDQTREFVHKLKKTGTVSACIGTFDIEAGAFNNVEVNISLLFTD